MQGDLAVSTDKLNLKLTHPWHQRMNISEMDDISAVHHMHTLQPYKVATAAVDQCELRPWPNASQTVMNACKKQ